MRLPVSGTISRYNMPIYSIAGLNVEFKSRFKAIERKCIEYLSELDAPADVTVYATDEDLRRERLSSSKDVSDEYIESVCLYRNLCLQMPRFNGMLLHSSVVSVGNRGIAFLARSGVGKSTHTLLWKKMLGEECTIVNGDKPIVRLEKGVPIAYGTPWGGKEGLQTNTKVQLTDLCFIERNDTDSVEGLDLDVAVGRIMQQVLLPSDPQDAAKTLELADTLLKKCRLWLIKCTPNLSAAEVAYKTICGDKNEIEI